MAQAMPSGKGAPGFSLMEMLVVLAIIAALAAVAAPVMTAALHRARETALRENLGVMRKLIDDYRADRAEYPDGLERLVKDGYLRAVPVDPIMADGSTEWAIVEAKDGGIENVHSRSTATGTNGVPYGQW